MSDLTEKLAELGEYTKRLHTAYTGHTTPLSSLLAGVADTSIELTRLSALCAQAEGSLTNPKPNRFATFRDDELRQLKIALVQRLADRARCKSCGQARTKSSAEEITATTDRALWHEIDEERRARGWRSVFDREADDADH